MNIKKIIMDRILKIMENCKRNIHEFKVLKGFNESLETSEYTWIFSNYFEVFKGIFNLKIKKTVGITRLNCTRSVPRAVNV